MLGDTLISLFASTFGTFFQSVLGAFVVGLVVPFFDFLADALCLT